MKKLIISAGLLFAAMSTLHAQKSNNHNFEISKNLEIFNDIYKQLDLFYVDSLSADTVIEWAIDGMLQQVDPFTEYYPESNMEELREMKLGYRSRYICGAARMIAEGGVDLGSLPEMEYARAREELMKLPGIGRKVADCICLFALHQMDAFPVDTHIQKALDAHYRDGFPFEQYQGCAGVMQQYIFYRELLQ